MYTRLCRPLLYLLFFSFLTSFQDVFIVLPGHRRAPNYRVRANPITISIHVCSAQDLGTAVRPRQGVLKGQQGDDIIMPRAPVCWLIPHSSVTATRKRSPFSAPFSMWCNITVLLAVFAVCQFTRPWPWRSRGAPVRSLGSVETTCEAWSATLRDFPIF